MQKLTCRFFAFSKSGWLFLRGFFRNFWICSYRCPCPDLLVVIEYDLYSFQFRKYLLVFCDDSWVIFVVFKSQLKFFSVSSKFLNSSIFYNNKKYQKVIINIYGVLFFYYLFRRAELFIFKRLQSICASLKHYNNFQTKGESWESHDINDLPSIKFPHMVGRCRQVNQPSQ